MNLRLSLILTIITLLFGCESLINGEPKTSTEQVISSEIQKIEAQSIHSLADTNSIKNYDLTNPTRILPLPGKLMEISGLSYDPVKNKLLGIHDEKGNIYIINPNTGKVENHIDFGRGGDYEGIELVEDKVYVIKSNGTMSVYNLEKKKSEDKIKTPLSTVNDVEGLGYLKNENALLIACKGQGSLDKDEKLKKTKAFYQYDLTDEKFIKKPWLKIKDKDLIEKVEKHFPKEKHSKKFIKKMKERAKQFSPSGIAVHPQTGNYFILSSQGKLLLEINPTKQIHSLFFLDKKHAQPEGICFAPNSDLFISNEGKGLSAKIFVYEKK